MMEFVTEHLIYWHWLALAVFLAIAEMLLPGTALLWVGAAAAITGIVSWLLPAMDWQWQFFTFGVVGVIAVMLSHRYCKMKNIKSADPLLNQRHAGLIGQTLTLTSPILNGHGRVAINDGSWLVTGVDLPAGSKVLIVGVEGAVLRVEAA